LQLELESKIESIFAKIVNEFKLKEISFDKDYSSNLRFDENYRFDFHINSIFLIDVELNHDIFSYIAEDYCSEKGIEIDCSIGTFLEVNGLELQKNQKEELKILIKKAYIELANLIKTKYLKVCEYIVNNTSITTIILKEKGLENIIIIESDNEEKQKLRKKITNLKKKEKKESDQRKREFYGLLNNALNNTFGSEHNE
ncbi:MAG: hypothetical protein WC934_04760, partial [Acidithiobacillus sp.]|uniref:hypothetical protein n=1 Tax=Acidithiobacillus sp. TaxID=1872118 RepID=UPI003560183C